VVSEELKSFIYHSFENLEQLRIVLLLHRDAQRELSLLEICSQIYLPPARVLAEIQILEKKGLITMRQKEEKRFAKYAPQTQKMGELTDKVAQMDREMPVSLINLIYDRPKNQLQIFADAFKLKKDE
jgi:DNA-binding MarR family transcriptional regulator